MSGCARNPHTGAYLSGGINDPTRAAFVDRPWCGIRRPAVITCPLYISRVTGPPWDGERRTQSDPVGSHGANRRDNAAWRTARARHLTPQAVEAGAFSGGLWTPIRTPLPLIPL